MELFLPGKPGKATPSLEVSLRRLFFAECGVCSEAFGMQGNLVDSHERIQSATFYNTIVVWGTACYMAVLVICCLAARLYCFYPNFVPHGQRMELFRTHPRRGRRSCGRLAVLVEL